MSNFPNAFFNHAKKSAPERDTQSLFLSAGESYKTSATTFSPALPPHRIHRRTDTTERENKLLGKASKKTHTVFRIGVPALDNALPWRGLSRAALHEISDHDVDAAGMGFASALIVRLLQTCDAENNGKRSVLWCTHAKRQQETGILYGPGLAAFGLAPSRLILVRVKRASDVLRVMREGLMNNHIAAVIGEGVQAGLTDSRRLQLAAEVNNSTAFLLRPSNAKSTANASLTRWSAESSPSGPVLFDSLLKNLDTPRFGFGPARWDLQLERCRGGRPKKWSVEWNPEAAQFSLL